MVIICDISAWQYWGTPPLLSRVPIADESPLALPVDATTALQGVPRVRSNARESSRLVQGRLLEDLKGLRLPVHVMTDDTASHRGNEIVVPHRVAPWVSRDHLVDIGGGLHVLSPAATLCSQPRRRPGDDFAEAVLLAKMMYELTGIFALAPITARTNGALTALDRSGLLDPRLFKAGVVYGFSDELGRRLGDHDDRGEPLSWTPVFDGLGGYVGMWKRPALTSVEEIGLVMDSLGCVGERSPKRRALAMVSDGAASPLEAKAHMLLCSGRKNGGEGWGRPFLNRRIVYSEQAASLAHARWCYADELWVEQRGILEVLGEGFHADDQGFRLVSGRTAALESMGFTVAEVVHEQMSDLELFDAILPALGRKLGFVPCERTPAFLKRRNELHRELFCMPYGPS